MEKKRCGWLNLSNPVYVAYHDTEWCVPVHDDRKLFECLVLESAQAGLSWETILMRREGYRKAFKDFIPKKVANISENEIEKLVVNPNIIRHRGKITSTVKNAIAFIEIQKEFGSFSKFLWKYIEDIDTKNMDAMNKVSQVLSKDLKKRGFKFCGPTICYAYMQAVGMVNDHNKECFRYSQCE
jgi:DNA-3-methyladenine glycosylase I